MQRAARRMSNKQMTAEQLSGHLNYKEEDRKTSHML